MGSGLTSIGDVPWRKLLASGARRSYRAGTNLHRGSGLEETPGTQGYALLCRPGLTSTGDLGQRKLPAPGGSLSPIGGTNPRNYWIADQSPALSGGFGSTVVD
jgi:hypothetical protein